MKGRGVQCSSGKTLLAKKDQKGSLEENVYRRPVASQGAGGLVSQRLREDMRGEVGFVLVGCGGGVLWVGVRRGLQRDLMPSWGGGLRGYPLLFPDAKSPFHGGVGAWGLRKKTRSIEQILDL